MSGLASSGVRRLLNPKGALAYGVTHPCILKEVVDRRTLGHIRPLCSMGHYKNLHDRTRTVAGVKTLSTDI
ncbi:hypothetical protein [Nostoc sp. UHCC 0302]|uniref:hypothetical protein n=1 Tax=Nostoc sp. UHCC 0302 TaxID=3134896 RepID=UPI00311CA409